jgi:hypothetical protein
MGGVLNEEIIILGKKNQHNPINTERGKRRGFTANSTACQAITDARVRKRLDVPGDASPVD